MAFFLITNKCCKLPGAYYLAIKSEDFNLYVNQKEIYYFSFNNDRYSILLDGFVLPKFKYIDRYQNCCQEEFLSRLIKRHGFDFIQYVKGSFLLLLVKNNEFTIFNDAVGIKKFFFYKNSGHFLISNTLSLISNNIEAEIDLSNIAVMLLMNNFIDGMTFLKNIEYSKPGSMLSWKKSLKMEHYFDFKEFLELEPKDVSFHDFSITFHGIIKSYLDFFCPKEVALSLTGGLDSRTILSALLNIGLKPLSFTYGSPQSADVAYAKKLAAECNIEYQNIQFHAPSGEWFSELSDKIVDEGNSTVNIHRAHRLGAFTKFIGQHPNLDMYFVGHMGGEAIRGIYFDDLIITEFTKKCLTTNIDKKVVVPKILDGLFFRTEQINFDKIIEILDRQKYFGPNQLTNEFYALWLLEAAVHHSQDLNLFGNYINYSVPVFMDIDFLSLLYSSRFSFLTRRKKKAAKLDRFNSGQELNCNIIKLLSPQIAHIPFSKRGYYSAQEYLGNHMILYLKRAKRYANWKTYRSNFELGGWMADFVGSKLKFMENNKIIHEIFDIDKLKRTFETTEHLVQEGYWRKYTNIVTIELLTRRYLRNL